MIEGRRLNPMLIGRLVDNIQHQGIGGKRIILEREFTVNDILDQPIQQMNIACVNFLMRRMDFVVPHNGNKKLYYGHVNGLGYFIAEDELVGTITTASDEEIREVW